MVIPKTSTFHSSTMLVPRRWARSKVLQYRTGLARFESTTTGTAPSGTVNNTKSTTPAEEQPPGAPSGTVNNTESTTPPEGQLPGVPYRSAGFRLMNRENLRPPPSIISIEEHYSLPQELLDKHNVKTPPTGYPEQMPMMQYSGPRMLLTDGMRGRLADMDRGKIAMQILSLTGNTKFENHRDEVSFAQDVNNYLADQITNSAAPHRFRAFAYMPMRSPIQAAKELERCVTEKNMVGALVCGQTDGNFLDHPVYAPLLKRAEDLKVPIYVHPSFPPPNVMDAYYSNLPGALGTILASCAFGWHAEAAIHVLRLVLSGTLDRHPDLNIITGHHGQMLPMMLQRMDNLFSHVRRSPRSVTETIRDQLYVSFAGMYTIPNVQIAIEQFGVDHIMWSCDYPWLPAEETRGFFGVLNDLLHPSDLRKICQTNAERLLKIQCPEDDQIREMVIEDEKEAWLAKKKAKEMEENQRLNPAPAADPTGSPNSLQVSYYRPDVFSCAYIVLVSSIVEGSARYFPVA